MSRAAWTVLDQAVVSGGTFAVSVLLARGLPPHEYGAYVLLLSGMLMLQLFNATLLFHPFSVRMPVADRAEQPALLSATLALVALLSTGLGGLLALALVALGRAELVPAALCAFIAWQVQETLRRGLLTTFRHRTAILGDAVSYLGQAALVGSLAFAGTLSLGHTLYGLGATSALAAVVQWLQLGLRLRPPRGLRGTAADFWSIGGFWALGNGLLMLVRFQLVTWGLATNSGPAAVAALQAAQNVVNLSNPIAIGFGNIVPQAAAQASKGGHAAAWRAVQAYAVLAVIPILGYTALVLAVPSPILAALYGAGSEYAELTTVLRLLIIAGLASYVTELVVWYLHGISAVPLAFGINAAGALATAAFVLPLISQLGLKGACLTVIGANLVRLTIARHFLLKTTAAQPQLA